MLGLILKDFIILKRYIMLSFFFGVWMLAAGRPNNLPLLYFCSGWMMVWFILARGVFAMDEHIRSEALINSLPLSRREIVFGRHITSMVFAVYGFLVMAAWHLILKLAGSNGRAFPWMAAVTVGLGLVALLTLVYFPILFKFGYMKTRWFSLFLIVAVVSLGSGAYRQRPDWMGDLLGLSGPWIPGIVLAAFAALMLLSILICTALYRTREF